MKKKLISLMEILLFAAILAAMVVGLSLVTERKASRNRLDPFLERAEEYDVLFMGDSHMNNAVFPLEMWADYGIVSYNLASYGSSIPVSYWTLINALDYASPKLVVLDITDVSRSEKLTWNSNELHHAIDGFPLTRNKSRMLEDLMSDPQLIEQSGKPFTEFKIEFYFKLAKYHGRWSELTREDFFPVPTIQKGADMKIGVAVPNAYEINDDLMPMEERGSGFDYLRRFIDECQNREIDILLVNLPYPASEGTQRAAFAVQCIADEYGVDFVDLVNLDQVLDYETDCFDPYSHINPSGARKTSDYLGRYITDHYDIPDRRNDPACMHWHEDLRAYEQMKMELIAGETSLTHMMMLLHDDSISAAAVMRPGAPLYQDAQALKVMQNIAREHIFEEDAFSKWSHDLFPLQMLSQAAQAGSAYAFIIDREAGSVQEFSGETVEAPLSASFAQGILRASAEELSIENGGRTIDAPQDMPVQFLLYNHVTGETLVWPTQKEN